MMNFTFGHCRTSFSVFASCVWLMQRSKLSPCRGSSCTPRTKSWLQAKFLIRLELDDAADALDERIRREPGEFGLGRVALLQRRPRHDAADARIVLRHFRHPVGLLLKLRGVALALEKDHLRHLHRTAGLCGIPR
jgi:hypothetical protein